MKSNIPNKIHIIGSVGSGKTTLARTLSSKLNIPFYELDNVVWKRCKSGDIRRSEEERDECLNHIIHSAAWIVEGVHHKWVLPSFQNAELIIFLDTDYSKRTFRIIKRFILQKIGLEKANYKPSFKIFMKMFEWNYYYFENESKPEILNMLSQYNDKLIILKDNTEIKKYFASFGRMN
ncbi:AAA family ATPase [Thermaerobacillus caldiproteolyticus]|uniref:AAA family ATPase n=1 Tax=Thermaerobacillus caldiproteolyticus TaxID=247480 RepID=UPI0018F22734|nr:AAA family ATPase [Anoxybacillus caldiproteolyticus]